MLMLFVLRVIHSSPFVTLDNSNDNLANINTIDNVYLSATSLGTRNDYMSKKCQKMTTYVDKYILDQFSSLFFLKLGKCIIYISLQLFLPSVVVYPIDILKTNCNIFLYVADKLMLKHTIGLTRKYKFRIHSVLSKNITTKPTID